MNPTSVIGKALAYVFPQTLLEATPWQQTWDDKERHDFIGVARVFFPLAAALYVAHYFLFDKPMGLEPLRSWLLFRLSMATVALAALAFYLSPLSRFHYYRVPAVLALLLFCYSQAEVTVIYPDAPWMYCFLFVGISTLVLRASVLASVFFVLSAFVLQWSALIATGIPTPTLLSAAFVTLILIIASRGGYVADIRYFLLTQQNTDSQRRNIELNIEFTDRIKSFIPGEIAKRLDSHLQSGDMTVLQAIDEVLRPRKKNVACLFSDIRGFTEASKNLEQFVGELVLPNVKACTSAIDDNGGVPRKIGDLIFAYFDGGSPHLNLLRSLRAGFQIAEINQSQNLGSTEGEKITRYILIATGEAYVGNVGGFDSSVEITALGSPVNLLSRIDEITKNPKISVLLQSGDIVLSSSAHSMLMQLGLRPSGKKLHLHDLGVTVRNFSDEKFIFVMSPNESNRQHFDAFYKLAVETQESGVEPRPVKVA